MIQFCKMRYFFLLVLCCLGLFSCKKSGNFDKLQLSHLSDTIGGKLILKGVSSDGDLSEYTVLFNDMETKPSQRLSPHELEVVVPVQARSGLVTIKRNSNLYQSADTFYVVNQKRWKRAADFPGEGRIRSTAFVIGTKAYIATGANAYNGVYFKDLWEYDSLKDKWARKADFPGATRYMAISFTLNGKGYVGGGFYSPPYDCAQDLYEYTPESNTWKKMANPPSSDDLCHGTASVYNNQGYIFSERGDRKTSVFDANTNTWSAKSTAHNYVFIRDGASFVLANKLYYGLGRGQTPWVSGEFVSSSMYGYNLSSNSWSPVALDVQLKEQSVYENAFVYNGEAYMAFGEAGKLYSYQPNGKRWNKVVDQKLGVTELCSTFMIGSRGFVVFGHKYFEDKGTNKLWVINLNNSPTVR